MPVPAVLDADQIRLPIRLTVRLGDHLRLVVGAVTGRIGRPRGAAPSPRAAPLTPVPAGAACFCPCSVELPGEAA